MKSKAIEILEVLVKYHDYRSLDLGIGVNFPENRAWIEARKLVETPGEDN